MRNEDGAPAPGVIAPEAATLPLAPPPNYGYALLKCSQIMRVRDWPRMTSPR